MLDLDHFKHYNDTHGHQAGDRLLKQVARTETAEELLDRADRALYQAKRAGRNRSATAPNVKAATALVIVDG